MLHIDLQPLNKLNYQLLHVPRENIKLIEAALLRTQGNINNQKCLAHAIQKEKKNTMLHHPGLMQKHQG